jgi:hypothetical protein
MIGLFEAMVAVPVHKAKPRPQTSGLVCDPDPARGTNEFAICEGFEIFETGDWSNSDGNGAEVLSLFADNYVFKANWETDRRGKMIAIPKNEILEAFDFIENLTGFKDNPNEDVFITNDSKEIKTINGVSVATGEWEIKENGWKGTWTLVAKDGKITSSTGLADKATLQAILALDEEMQRGNFA